MYLSALIARDYNGSLWGLNAYIDARNPDSPDPLGLYLHSWETKLVWSSLKAIDEDKSFGGPSSRLQV